MIAQKLDMMAAEAGLRAMAWALATCRLHRAMRMIAKLDRLSCDAHFLLELQKAGVEFVATDMPNADTMSVGVMAVMVQHERALIGAHQGGAGREGARRQARQPGQSVYLDRDVRYGHPPGRAAPDRFAKLEEFRAVVACYDKADDSFRACISLAAAITFRGGCRRAQE